MLHACLGKPWALPLAREPTVLRVACQYVLSLRNIAAMLALTCDRASWSMGFGSRHCIAVTLASMISTGGCTVEPLPRYAQWQVAPSSTLAPTWRGRPRVTMNGAAGELLGLVPALRRAHSDLRVWLARDHPAHLRVTPDILAQNGWGLVTPGPFRFTSNMSSVS